MTEMPISKDDMELRKQNIANCLGDKITVAGFVDVLLSHLKSGSQLTITIKQVRSGDFFALSVIDELSEDTRI